MLKQKSIIISIVVILSGSCMFYFNGYKDSGLIKGMSYLLILVGWVGLSIVSVGPRLLGDKKMWFKKNKINWLEQKLFHAFCYLTIGLLIVGNVILVSSLTDKRVSKVLQSHNQNKQLQLLQS